ncbi:hypothetical protein B0H63DRAFT_476378 [Podospora didyma]|uniref:Methyltransferase type 11 domain-containing protein n=1 Tax=Podospora didyma TaxID=330526 RepID=A0AAE0NHP6_9PEZI|nr:hypothetical protein B0H63DRAFT_476378 [Podospora didyma]
MASTTTPIVPLPFPTYFTALSAVYAKQTGNTTRNIFAATLPDITALAPITPTSTIHDNAAGPGTATSVLVDPHLGLLPESPSSILVTDNVAAMVSAARDSFASLHRPNVTVQELDSLSLSTVPDSSITHSILNFSIFTMADPLKCLQETRRTLASDGGIAALLTWRRWGAGEIVHAAQRIVRPDLPVMKIPGREFMDEGVLEKLTVEAGFERTKITVLEKTLLVKEDGEEMAGLKEFLVGVATGPAKIGWTEEEAARWPEAVEQAVRDEVRVHGGVLFQAWVVLARK